MDQSQYDQYGGFDASQQYPFGLEFGFQPPQDARNPAANAAVPPRPPALQVEAQLDAGGNWFYPSADQENHNLRIQCDAFRAGAASASGVALPFRPSQGSIIPPPVTPRAPTRTILRPVSRRVSRPVRQKPTGNRRRKKTSVTQICVCHEKTFTPKRPPNAFMMFRTKFQPELVKTIESNPSLRKRNKNGREASLQAAVSSLASEWWNEAKDRGEDKQFWDLAEAEKQAHALRNPGYKYESGKKYQLNWGDESCTCGAFEANEAKRRGREDGTLHHDPKFIQYEYEDFDEEEEEEGDPPYPSATVPRGLKRPISRGSLMEPPAKRRGGSAVVKTAGAAGLQEGLRYSSIVQREGYDGGNADPAYEGGMGGDMFFPNTNQTGTGFDPQRSNTTRSQSGAGISPTARRHSRPSTSFSIWTGADITEEALRDMVAGVEDVRGDQYNNDISQNDLFTYTGGDEIYPQGDDTHMREAGRESYDSLFDMDAYVAPRSSVSRSSERQRSLRASPTSPSNAASLRRSSRRSRG